MPSLKSITSAFCFYLLMTFCAESARADSTYTYTGKPFGFSECFRVVPFCFGNASLDGSVTLASPLGDNLRDVIVEPESFSFGARTLIVTNLTVTAPSMFAFSTNASGQIVGWDVSITGDARFNGLPALVNINSYSHTAFNTGEEAADDLSGNSPVLGGAGNLENLNTPGTWTVSTRGTNVPEPASGTLLIAGLVGLAGLALKKAF
jgi:hypothetical protein